MRKKLRLQEIFNFDSPSELQRQAADFTDSPGVVLVEAPMGAGKTEAALALAYRLLAEGRAGESSVCLANAVDE